GRRTPRGPETDGDSGAAPGAYIDLQRCITADGWVFLCDAAADIVPREAHDRPSGGALTIPLHLAAAGCLLSPNASRMIHHVNSPSERPPSLPAALTKVCRSIWAGRAPIAGPTPHISSTGKR